MENNQQNAVITFILFEMQVGENDQKLLMGGQNFHESVLMMKICQNEGRKLISMNRFSRYLILEYEPE